MEEIEEILEILKSTKRAEAPAHLYDNILKKIQQRKKSTVSIVWVRAAAAVLICMISVEVVLVRNSFVEQERNALKSILPTNNNILYNE